MNIWLLHQVRASSLGKLCEYLRKTSPGRWKLNFSLKSNQLVYGNSVFVETFEN